MKENNFNPSFKESKNFPKTQFELKKKKITKHTRIPDTMNESQHKQELTKLEYGFFNHWKDYTIRMFQAIEWLKIYRCVKIK